MFLQSVRLKNFRGFADHELSFTDPPNERKEPRNRKTTILLGRNGMGKSNLLKAIGLIVAGRSALSELLRESDSWIQYRKRFCQIDATLTTKAGETREVSLRIERGRKRHEILDRNQDSMAELDDALSHTQRNYFVIGYGASRRLNTGRTQSRRASMYSEPRAQCLSSLFDPDAPLTPIEEWAIDLDYRKDSKAVSSIKNVLSQFHQDIKFKRIDKDNGQLMFQTPDGIIPMSALSDGFQNVASWIGDLLFRVTETFEDFSKPLHTRGLLLIDEIDLHLHPIWQRELLSFLEQKLPNMQVVATTHSPITAQQAGSNQLHYIERADDELSIHQFEGDPGRLLLHQLVMSDAFGLTSDESVEIETKKNRVEELESLKKLNKAQQSEHKKLVSELAEVPTRARSASNMTDRQAELIQRIQAELEGRNQ